ncbi:MAG: Rieske 2Fe-2S domain-containing protein [Alphaproteobacteria bacterium]|nr:MAG: Rieske 2Fe-2S domain-containing protein [Alphaproteobacteria bacterium]
MAWQRIASLSEIAVDAVLGVDVDGSRVALYRLANEVFATAGICTHAMALLSDGFVEDGNIECPLHQSQFDIRSGKALCAPATEDLRTYAVKLDGDEVLIDMEQQAEFTQVIPKLMPDRQAARNIPVTDTRTISATNSGPELALMKRYVWPAEGLTRIPDWVYTDQTIYEREVEKIFHGRTWNYVALECEVPNPGDFIRSNVGPTPVVVVRAADCSINVFENRCSHRAAEFCRELSGNTKEFVCPYHQWSYDLHGNLAGVPFRRGVNGKGGMPADFNVAQHGLRRLNVTSHRGVVFASYVEDMESLQDYLGPEVLKEFEATFDGRKPRLLGYYRHTLPGNWKLYHENLKDPYHATLLHTFLVTFGLLVAGNRSLMLADATGRHGVMASAKSERKSISTDAKKEMRAYRDGMTLAEPRFMDFIEEFDSPWSVTMATIWPNLIIQREMNTLGVRQIVPTGPHEFIMKWTMFGFEGDDDEMTRHRLRQGNLMGPAGFLGLEDNEAIKFVQDGMRHVPGRQHLVKLDPAVAAGTSDSLISEASIRAMYRHWRAEMGL